MRVFLKIVAVLLLIAAAALYLIVFWPLRTPHPTVRLAKGVIAVKGATIYVSPDLPPIQDATLVARDGRIVAIGSDVAVSSDAQLIPCNQCIVTAGFWNAHIHFTERKWLWSAWKPRATLNPQLADMLTSRGFTTVVDVGSDLRETVSLRRRIESGDLNGPKIYTAGSAIYPANGIPYYLKNTLPPLLLKLMPQPATPAEAVKDEERSFTAGADLLKLFTGSYIAPGTVLPMRQDIAAAAVQAAHAHGQLAFSHASNYAGVTVAMNSGVDVLAHAPDETEGIDAAYIQRIVDLHMAMIPTLKMFQTTVTTNPAYLQPIYAVVQQFHQDGGQLIFGTDVGYMTDYTTEDEFRALAQSGLSAMDILRMLTVAPADRFGTTDKGTLAIGKLADFIVLDTDPAKDVAAFAAVRTTVRSGRVIYTR